MYSNSAAVASRRARKPGTVHEFGLERPKEALHGGIVEAISLAAHGGLDAMEAEQFAVVTACI